MFQNENLDTKEKVFRVAAELFGLHGYENVSIRMIADKVGIKSSSIYNHFKSKDAILEACYNHYIVHRYDTRLDSDEYESILLNGTKQEVLDALNYEFNDMIMFYLVLIVFSRTYTDEKAKELYQSEITNSIAYLQEYFNKGIELGRFSEFNVPVYAQMCMNTRLFTASCASIDHDQPKWRVTETDIFNELANILPFRY